VLTVLTTVLCGVQSGAAESGKAAPARPRHIRTTDFAGYPPLFTTKARTLDPAEWARVAWQGYLTKKGDPWGIATDFKPTLRLSFDCRALPWPSIKHSPVDGLDNHGRGVGALALLHAMFGDEMANNPVELGQMTYLAGCTDPESGLAFSTESLSRGAPIAQGEMASNLLLLHKYSGQEQMREWAGKLLKSLREYAVVTERPGLGKVASYPKGGFEIGETPANVVTDPINPGYYPPGWNVIAFSMWYELTGDMRSLDFATALANRACHSEDPEGNDGAFRRDGSFGGTKQKNSLCLHVHTHTHCLPGFLHLGEQLLRTGKRDAGLSMIRQAAATFDWLYDPARNPDAGSLTGWLGEWLMVATGWERKTDCEGCIMGDVVQTAAALGAASRLDPSLSGYVDYYDRAEQMFSGQLVEQTFRLTPKYCAVLRDLIARRVAREMKITPLSSPAKIETSAGSGMVAVSLGTFSLSPGIYCVRVESDGLRPFMLNYIDVRGSAATNRYDAASWMGCSQSDLATGSKAKITPGSWHGDRYNLCSSDVTSGLPEGTAISARVPVDVPASGRFQLQASVIKSSDLGMIDFAIDGTNRVSLDCYQPAANSAWRLAPVAEYTLAAGAHMVTLTWTAGKRNSASSGADVFCDYITLDAGATKYDLENYCQDGIYDAKDKHVYGWTLNSDTACQPGFRGPAMAYFVNAGAGLSARVPFIVNTAGDYEVVATAIKSLCNANGTVSARVCQFKRPGADEEQEVERRYQAALTMAGRMVGQQLGLCGFPDWVNELPSDLDSELPGIHMQGCCADATIRAAHAVWAETVTGNAQETRVNLAFNRQSPLVDVVSCLPHRGELNVTVKTARRVLVRVPEWAPRNDTHTYVERSPVPTQWDGPYVVFANVTKGQQLTVTYGLRLVEVKETVGSLRGIEFTERWRGNTIVHIEPPGKWIPMFERPELESETVP